MRCNPDYYFLSACDISPRFLGARGICGLALDIDNTLALDGVCALPETVARWLAELRSAGLRAVVVSNSSEARASAFAAMCGLPYIARARKPGQHSVRRVLAALECEPSAAAMIGDQLFTDIVYGNCAGFTTILVERMGPDGLAFVRFKRLLERPFLRGIRKRGVTKDA